MPTQGVPTMDHKTFTGTPFERVEEGRALETNDLCEERPERVSNKRSMKKRKKKSKKRKGEKSSKKSASSNMPRDVHMMNGSSETHMTTVSTTSWMQEQEEECPSTLNENQFVRTGFDRASSVGLSPGSNTAMSGMGTTDDLENPFSMIDRRKRGASASASETISAGYGPHHRSSTKPFFVEISAEKLEAFQADDNDDSLGYNDAGLTSHLISNWESFAETESVTAMESGTDVNSALIQYLVSMGLEAKKAAHISKKFLSSQRHPTCGGTLPPTTAVPQSSLRSRGAEDTHACKMREVEEADALQDLRTGYKPSSYCISNHISHNGGIQESETTSADSYATDSIGWSTGHNSSGNGVGCRQARSLLDNLSSTSFSASTHGASPVKPITSPITPSALRSLTQRDTNAPNRQTQGAATDPPQTYQRHHRPDVVETVSLTFDAPERPPNDKPTVKQHTEQDGAAFTAIDARPVEDHVEATPLSLKHVLREKSMRRLLLIGAILLLSIAAGITAFFSTRPDRSADPPTAPTEPTMAPSSAPTFIDDEGFNAASSISNWGRDGPSAAQLDAIGWMSAVDKVDSDNFGESFVQRYALIVFYFATMGQDWTNRGSWLSPVKHECDWSKDIECGTDSTSRRIITGFEGTRNGLNGTLPSELFRLSSMKYLRLMKNDLSGTIPTELGYMSRLGALELESNRLTGSLPSSIGNATDLVTLKLSHNSFIGTLPDEFYNMTLLRILALENNRMTGTLSPLIKEFQRLDTLNIRHNQFSGTMPLEVKEIRTLDHFWIDYNQFTGTFSPFSIIDANRLELSMSHNLLSGSIPRFNNPKPLGGNDFSENVYRIQKIDLSHNRLTGTIEPISAFIPTLRYLDLSGNAFSGQFPGDFGWPSLEHVNLAHNQFEGTISSGFPALLQYYDMAGNKVTGSIPPALCYYDQLQFLNLADNLGLAGSIPSCLGSASSLRHVELSNTNASGALPPLLEKLSGLEHFDVSGNSLTSTIPGEIWRWSELSCLDLSDNHFQGQIPSALGQLRYLRMLDLSNNALTGTLPEEFGTLTNMESLILAPGNPALAGKVPPGLCLGEANMTTSVIGYNIECSCCIDTAPCGI